VTWREKVLVGLLLLIVRIIAAGIKEFDPALAAEIKTIATHISVNAPKCADA
jgi:hypothetical protein